MLEKETITEEKRLHFKSLLTRSLDDLFLAENEKNTGRFSSYEDDGGDYTDLASLDTDRNLNLRLRERESRLAEKILSALRKLEDGTYGICEECGEPISEKRLMARPIARLCIQCKEQEEMKEAMWGQ
jgi:DnaK suppressor protein